MATSSQPDKHNKLSGTRLHATRLNRCLRLLNMLQSRIGYSAQYLALELNVSRRTIYRDLCLLAEAGIAAYYDANKRGYILQDQRNLRTCGLSDDEITSLLLAAHIFSLSCDRKLSGPILQAIGKLLGELSPGLRGEIAGLLNLIKGRPSQPMWLGGSQPVIAEILAALRQKRPIRITYCSAEASVPAINTKLSSYRLTRIIHKHEGTLSF